MAQFVGAPVEFEIIAKPDYVRRHKDHTRRGPHSTPSLPLPEHFPPGRDVGYEFRRKSAGIHTDFIASPLPSDDNRNNIRAGTLWDASRSSDFPEQGRSRGRRGGTGCSGPNGLTGGNYNTERPGEESSSRVEWYPSNTWEPGQNGIPSGR